MKTYDFLNNTLFKDKSIVYVPIISCINRDTNEYNLAADGNVNRFITTFCKCDSFKKLTIFLPKKHVKDSEKIITEFADEFGADLVWIEDFGIHAKDQRVNENIVDKIYAKIKELDFDLCLFESQALGLKLAETKKQLVWWNPVSATETKTREFLIGYEETNAKVISVSDYMIIASQDQIKYYSNVSEKLIYIDVLIDRTLKFFNYQIDEDVLKYSKYKDKLFFLPFRLTDSGYKFDKVLEYLKKEKENWIALYTDPNNSHVIDCLDETIKSKFIKVDSKRDTYYTILDHTNATILYFEDLEFINHAAIHEFKQSNCNVILWQQHNNPYDIDKCPNIHIIDEI